MNKGNNSKSRITTEEELASPVIINVQSNEEKAPEEHRYNIEHSNAGNVGNVSANTISSHKSIPNQQNISRTSESSIPSGRVIQSTPMIPPHQVRQYETTRHESISQVDNYTPRH